MIDTAAVSEWFHGLGPLGPWLAGALAVAIAAAVAMIIHRLLFAVLARVTAQTGGSLDETLVAYARPPALWILLLLAVNSVLPGLPMRTGGEALAGRLLALATTAALGWLLVALVRGTSAWVTEHYDTGVADNLRARRLRTRTVILQRVVIGVIALVTVCLMLMSFPSIRQIGVTLFASAGLAGLAVAAAAQPALKNLVAGLQLAFSEPIRLDDVVIWNGDFARVEEIRSTYVVLKTWDERRLVVPVSKFLEETFENWTREGAQLLGTVFLHLDFTAPVDAIRAEAERVIRADTRWDGRVAGAQVTDFKDQVIELRLLMSSSDSAKLFDLRCAVREAMIVWLRDHHPEALPRQRTAVVPSGTEAPMPIKLERQRLAAVSG